MLDAAGDKPVTFRTLDIGGDKVLPYMETVRRKIPALGWRAIRLGLDRPGLLRGQIRALLRAGGSRALRIMFPMISKVAEFDQAKELVERELTYLRQHGHELPERVDVGTMVEVPALLYQLDELLEKVDFVSVGSNDLFQFLFAVDRGNPRVSDRFDTLSAPILRALSDIVDKAAEQKIRSLCGEMASKPIGALALIAIGYRSLSLSATAHGPVKAMMLDLDARKADSVDAAAADRAVQAACRSARNSKVCRRQGLAILGQRPKDFSAGPCFGIRDDTMSMLPDQKLNMLLARHALAGARARVSAAGRELRAAHRANSPNYPRDRGGEFLSRRQREIAGIDQPDRGSRDRCRDARASPKPRSATLEARRAELEQRIAARAAAQGRDGRPQRHARNPRRHRRRRGRRCSPAICSGCMSAYAAMQGWKVEMSPPAKARWAASRKSSPKSAAAAPLPN